MGELYKITKDNWRKYTKSALMPGYDKKHAISQQASVEIEKNVALLQKCERMYNSLQSVREAYQECANYIYGDQLGRMIPDPEGCKPISIRNYAIKQGMTPLTMNLITSRVRQMVGVYSKQKLEDLVVSRDKDKTKLGEVMSTAMQYLYQKGNIYRINTDGYRDFLIGAIPIFRTGYDFDSERKLSDVYADLEDLDYMFWDDNTSGNYFKNISTIGKLHEFSQQEILTRFAKTPAMRTLLLNAFAECNSNLGTQQFTKDKTEKTVSFYTPTNPDKYRIIEVWTKEERQVLVYIDPLEKGGVEHIVDIDKESWIVEENNRRRVQIMQYGGDGNDAATIDYEYRCDTNWVVRYLDISGHVLYKAESPYAHGSHPWALGGYPMVKGRVQSLVHDMIPAQDMINRLVMRMEFTRMNQAKGFGIVDKKVLEDSNVSEEDFAKAYTSSKKIMALYTQGAGGIDKVFKRFNDEGGTNSDAMMLQTYITILDQQSGSTDAARGERGGSHESASRYMMETENSSNNTADGEQWYNGLILLRDYKLMTLMQQYYSGKRYLNIAGAEYSEESKYYDSDKIKETLFDLSILQRPSNGVVRMMMNDTIATLLQYGAIDGDTALQAYQDYGMDALLKIKQRNQEKAMEMQQAALQQQAAMQQTQQQPQQTIAQ